MADKFLGALTPSEQVYSYNLLEALDFALLFRSVLCSLIPPCSSASRMEQLTGIRLKPDAVVLLEFGSSMLYAGLIIVACSATQR